LLICCPYFHYCFSSPSYSTYLYCLCDSSYYLIYPQLFPTYHSSLTYYPLIIQLVYLIFDPIRMNPTFCNNGLVPHYPSLNNWMFINNNYPMVVTLWIPTSKWHHVSIYVITYCHSNLYLTIYIALWCLLLIILSCLFILIIFIHLLLY
jgi:hypothetical protein